MIDPQTCPCFQLVLIFFASFGAMTLLLEDVFPLCRAAWNHVRRTSRIKGGPL